MFGIVCTYFYIGGQKDQYLFPLAKVHRGSLGHWVSQQHAVHLLPTHPGIHPSIHLSICVSYVRVYTYSSIYIYTHVQSCAYIYIYTVHVHTYKYGYIQCIYWYTYIHCKWSSNQDGSLMDLQSFAPGWEVGFHRWLPLARIVGRLSTDPGWLVVGRVAWRGCGPSRNIQVTNFTMIWMIYIIYI